MNSINNNSESNSKKLEWFKEYIFVISYGVDGNIIPIEKKVIFRKLQLHGGSHAIGEYSKLSDEEKKKTLEAVFCSEDGHLVLRIPIGKLMDAKNSIRSSAKISLGDFKEEKGISVEDLGATIESVGRDKNGKIIRTVLGTNYSLFPLKAQIRIRERARLKDQRKIEERLKNGIEEDFER